MSDEIIPFSKYLDEIKQDMKQLRQDMKADMLMWKEEVKADYRSLQNSLTEIQMKLSSFVTKIDVDTLLTGKANVGENTLKFQEIENRLTRLESSPAKAREWIAFAIASLGCLFSSLLGLAGLILSLVNYFAQHLH